MTAATRFGLMGSAASGGGVSVTIKVWGAGGGGGYWNGGSAGSGGSGGYAQATFTLEPGTSLAVLVGAGGISGGSGGVGGGGNGAGSTGVGHAGGAGGGYSGVFLTSVSHGNAYIIAGGGGGGGSFDRDGEDESGGAGGGSAGLAGVNSPNHGGGGSSSGGGSAGTTGSTAGSALQGGNADGAFGMFGGGGGGGYYGGGGGGVTGASDAEETGGGGGGSGYIYASGTSTTLTTGSNGTATSSSSPNSSPPNTGDPNYPGSNRGWGAGFGANAPGGAVVIIDGAGTTTYTTVGTATHTVTAPVVPTAVNESEIANASLLLPLNSLNNLMVNGGSANLTDYSNNSHSMTGGSGIIWYDTNTAGPAAVTGYGGASRLPGTSGQKLLSPVSTSFQLGSGSWTIEFWAKPIGTGTNGSAVLQFSAGTDLYSMLVGYVDNGTWYYYISTSGSGWAVNGSMGTIVTGGQRHLALTYDGSNVRSYQEGSIVSTTGFNGTVYQATNQVSLGFSQGGSSLHVGYITDVRILKGVARYTGSSYTLPGPLVTY